MLKNGKSGEKVHVELNGTYKATNGFIKVETTRRPATVMRTEVALQSLSFVTGKPLYVKRTSASPLSRDNRNKELFIEDVIAERDYDDTTTLHHQADSHRNFKLTSSLTNSMINATLGPSRHQRALSNLEDDSR